MPAKLEVAYDDEVNVICNAGYELVIPSKTSWKTIFNSSKSYLVYLSSGGNVTVTCAAVNCSCTASGVPLTHSPWNKSCDCDCSPVTLYQQMPYCDDTCTVRLNTLSCRAKTCKYTTNITTSNIDLKGVHPSNLTTTYPNQITLACKEGFVSTQNCRNEFAPKCQASGTFSVQEGPCVRAECGPPYDAFLNIVENDVAVQGSEFNKTVRIQCNDGYVVSPPGCSEDALSFNTRCGSSKCKPPQGGTCGGCAWESQCTCTKVTCPPFEPPPNTLIDDKTYSSETVLVMGNKLKLRCMPGFQIVDTAKCEKTATLECDVTGNFSLDGLKEKFPGCEPIRCHHNPANFKDWESEDSVVAYKETLSTIELETIGPTLIGDTVIAKCRESKGYRPAGLSVMATCTESCFLQDLPMCRIQKCDAYMPMSLKGMVNNPEFASRERKKLGDSFTVNCMDGFYADDLSVLPGLGALGSVRVLAFALFDVPDPTKSQVFAMEGLYSSVSISVPPGAWPPELTTGPSAAVFTPPEDRRRSASQSVLGAFVSFGPPGVNFTAPIVISCPFNLTGIDEGNLEIRVHKYDTALKTFHPLPYPVRLSGRRNSAVDKERGAVEATVSSFDPPYVALANRIPVAPAPPPADVVIVARDNSAPPADEEPETKVSLWFLVLGFAIGGGLVLCCGSVYIIYHLKLCTKTEKTEPLLEEANSKANTEKNRKNPDEDAVQVNKIEVEEDTTVQADLIVIGKNGEVETVEPAEQVEPAEPADAANDTEMTPAAKLRDKSTVEVAI